MNIFLIMGLIMYLICPFLLIWALNTLFHCQIEWTFKNWFAALTLIFVARFCFKLNIGSHSLPYQDEIDGDNLEETDSSMDDPDRPPPRTL